MAASVAAAHEETHQRLAMALTAVCADFNPERYTKVGQFSRDVGVMHSDSSIRRYMRALGSEVILGLCSRCC